MSKCPKPPHEECKEGFRGSAKLQLQNATLFLLIHSSGGIGDISDRMKMRKISTAKMILILILNIIMFLRDVCSGKSMDLQITNHKKERDKPDDRLCLVDPGGQVHGRGGGRRPIVIRRTPKCWERRRRHPCRDSPVVSPWIFWHSHSQCRNPNLGLYPSSHVQSICTASQNKRSNFNDRRSSFLC